MDELPPRYKMTPDKIINAISLIEREIQQNPPRRIELAQEVFAELVKRKRITGPDKPSGACPSFCKCGILDGKYPVTVTDMPPTVGFYFKRD